VLYEAVDHQYGLSKEEAHVGLRMARKQADGCEGAGGSHADGIYRPSFK
jgi:hypothetical protein